MADSISTLPDSVLCYILSFLPTKDVVATSLLSKRWKPLWRSVPAFDFECECYTLGKRIRGINHNFIHSINTFLDSRDPLQSLRRFCLKCFPFEVHTRICHPTNVCNLISTVAMQHKLEHLELCIPCTFDFPSVVFSCKTLVVLELVSSVLKHFSSVDLPSLKIMRLYHISFSEYRLLAELLSGCPNLEDMEITGGLTDIESFATEVKFQKLPKLVRAVMNKNLIPLEVVSNVQFLCLNWMDKEVEVIEDLIPEFHNLISIEFGYYEHSRDWLEVFKVLKHCPKLQNLVIDQTTCEYDQYDEYDRGQWRHPRFIPRCISSHLKTCRVNNYGGYKTEFQFARYIMQNARVLQKMTIHTYRGTSKPRKLRMRKKLSLFCSTCKLSFT